MFSRFHLLCDNKVSLEELKNDCFIGEYRKKASSYKKNLEEYISVAFSDENLIINASETQNIWFKIYDKKTDTPHIFLSHKHDDFEYAEILAAWLYGRYGIFTFIDSNVWGSVYTLQHKLDDKFCKIDDESYSYRKVNITSSHVHIMLETSLTMMIDQCECFIWLDFCDCKYHLKKQLQNNPSVEETDSAWIYHEISTAQVIQRRHLNYYRGLPANESQTVTCDSKSSESKVPPFIYSLKDDLFKRLSLEEFQKGLEYKEKYFSPNADQYFNGVSCEALDRLYKHCGITDSVL